MKIAVIYERYRGQRFKTLLREYVAVVAAYSLFSWDWMAGCLGCIAVLATVAAMHSMYKEFMPHVQRDPS